MEGPLIIVSLYVGGWEASKKEFEEVRKRDNLLHWPMVMGMVNNELEEWPPDPLPYG
jgi:hypothetical protein